MSANGHQDGYICEWYGICFDVLNGHLQAMCIAQVVI